MVRTMITNDDNTQALRIELQNTVAPGWYLGSNNGGLVVSGPNAPNFISEVWRIARNIAYDDYVCITREISTTREYKISSKSRRGLAFEVRICAVADPSPQKGEAD